MRVYVEKSGVEFQAWFEANPGTPTIPASAHWKLYDVTNEKTLQDWTELTPTTESDETGITGVKVTIDIPGSLNVIQESKNSRELKRLIVVAAKDTDREFSETRDYYIRKVGRG
jgi:hypothetical protein